MESRRLLSASISGVLYQDLGNTGTLAAGDPPLANWPVFLDLNHNGVQDPGEPGTLTDASGRYTFSNIAAGSYEVRENPVTGFKPYLYPFVDVTVTDGEALANVDIGNDSLINFTYPALSAAANDVNNGLPTNTALTPNSSVAVNSNVALVANDNSVSTYQRLTGTQITTENLQQFFAGQPNYIYATDPETIYDTGPAKFLVAAIANTSTGSELLLASSQKLTPNSGVWHFHSIDVQASTGLTGVFASNISLSFNAGAVFVTADITNAGGAFVGTRMWIASRATAFSLTKTALIYHTFDPATSVGLAETALPDLHAANYSGKSIGTVGAAYFVTDTSATSGTLADVIRVKNPGVNAKFALTTLPVPQDVSIAITTTPPAAQPDGAMSIDTTLAPISATWRNNYFWLAETLVPSSGPDVGIATVYWFEMRLTTFAEVDDGSVSGSSISTDASTFAPDIVVNRDQYMALEFTASGPDLDPTVYVVSRRTPDGAHTIRPPYTLSASSVPYTGTTTASGLIDWGTNQIILDPNNQDQFWSISHAATDPASDTGPWSQTLVAFDIPPKTFPVVNS